MPVAGRGGAGPERGEEASAPDGPVEPPTDPRGPVRRHPVIAIDGPAGAGKSTVARALAARLRIDRLDTGAMYRAVTWAALRDRIDLGDPEALARLAGTLVISVDRVVQVDGEDVTDAIRDGAVNAAVSAVAAAPEVRSILVDRQRRWVREHHGGILEGRDIGTVVLPDADLKLYLTASPEERARRRSDEGAAAVARRDRLDSTRAASPLSAAADARIVDTTGRTVPSIVEEVVAWLDPK